MQAHRSDPSAGGHSPSPRDNAAKALDLRIPEPRDGARMWRLVRDGGTLDLNSAYAYLMMADYFRDTCVIAERGGETAGFITGFLPPGRENTLFVWQVGVAPANRKQGLAQRMIHALLARPACRRVRFIEATVGPSNAASSALFKSMARDLKTQCAETEAYAADLFPGGGHEAEILFRVGPFSPVTKEGASS